MWDERSGHNNDSAYRPGDRFPGRDALPHRHRRLVRIIQFTLRSDSRVPLMDQATILSFIHTPHLISLSENERKLRDSTHPHPFSFTYHLLTHISRAGHRSIDLQLYYQAIATNHDELMLPSVDTGNIYENLV